MTDVMDEKETDETDERDLDQLIIEINKRHDECEEAEASALKAGIAAGKALLEAQEQVDVGYWMEWMKENLTCSANQAQRYMRFAYFAEQLAEAGVTTINDAIKVCKFDLVRPRGHIHRINKLQTPDLTERVRKLRAEGVSYTDIGKQLGFSYSTVRSWVDPDFRRNKREQQKHSDDLRREMRREAKRVKRQLERDQLAKSKGGTVSQAYSLMRRALSELDRALGETDDVDVRAALQQAISHAGNSEDYIVAALRGKAAPDNRRPDGGRF